MSLAMQPIQVKKLISVSCQKKKKIPLKSYTNISDESRQKLIKYVKIQFLF